MTQTIDLSRFKNASQRLREAHARWELETESSSDEELLTMLRDSVTQRYEFTIEQAWKMMQRVLESDSDSKVVESARKGSRSVLRLAFEKAWINDFKEWSGFLDLRNDGSHNYDENIPEAILKALPALLPELAFTLAQLELTVQSAP
jgi:nucleotidyltransferase substrate binding protein (TIGR01987 family)